MISISSAVLQRLRSFPWRTLILPLELTALSAWVLFIGLEYLDFNPNLWPEGIELFVNSQSHAVWVAFQRCGACFLWDGSINGGAPSFIGMLGAPLHPVVMFSTLLFGYINGIKATILLSLWIAGLAQLWLGRILKLNPVVRLWCAGIAAAGGYLAGRMANGEVPIILATACCSLAIPALLQFLLSAGRRNTVVLGLVLASAILSGHAYMQIGFAVSILPAFAVFGLLLYRSRPFPWRRLFAAAGLALLLAAPLLVPVLHFLPLFEKGTDPQFVTAQPLQYLPLNLVISDPEYFYYPDLGKDAYQTAYYANYIGWLPVLLAAYAFTRPDKKIRALLLPFLAAAILVYLAAGAWTFRFLTALGLEAAGAIRYPALIAGLAPPLILAMAGLGAHAIWIRPRPLHLLRFRTESRWHVRIPERLGVILLLLFAMALSLGSVASFSVNFLIVQPGFRIPQEIFQWTAAPGVEWIQPPFGEYEWLPEMLERNFKLPAFVRPWHLKGQASVSGRFIIVPSLPEPKVESGWTLIRTVGNYRIYADESAEYAVLHTADAEIPCTAKGMWGVLDLACNSDAAGLLEVKEHYCDGWQAAIDGDPVALQDTLLLSVLVPAGAHTISFRYRPWDVPLGILLSAAGWLAAGWYCWSGRKEIEPEEIEEDILPAEPKALADGSIRTP